MDGFESGSITSTSSAEQYGRKERLIEVALNTVKELSRAVQLRFSLVFESCTTTP